MYIILPLSLWGRKVIFNWDNLFFLFGFGINNVNDRFTHKHIYIACLRPINKKKNLI